MRFVIGCCSMFYLLLFCFAPLRISIIVTGIIVITSAVFMIISTLNFGGKIKL